MRRPSSGRWRGRGRVVSRGSRGWIWLATHLIVVKGREGGGGTEKEEDGWLDCLAVWLERGVK